MKQVQDNAQFAAMLEALMRAWEGSEPSSENWTGGEHHPYFRGNGGMCFQSIPRVHHPREVLDRRFASSNLRGAKGWNYEGGSAC